jgi:hypothetical protein
MGDMEKQNTTPGVSILAYSFGGGIDHVLARE